MAMQEMLASMVSTMEIVANVPDVGHAMKLGRGNLFLRC